MAGKSRLKKEHRVYVESLIRECIFADFKEPEALRYIEEVGKVTLSRSTYYNIKGELASDEAVTMWGSYMGRKGFAEKQMNLIYEIEALKTRAWRALLEEEAKPPKVTKAERKAGMTSRREHKMMIAKSEIRVANARLEELIHNSKTIAEVKTYMNHLVDELGKAKQIADNQKNPLYMPPS